MHIDHGDHKADKRATKPAHQNAGQKINHGPHAFRHHVDEWSDFVAIMSTLFGGGTAAKTMHRVRGFLHVPISVFFARGGAGGGPRSPLRPRPPRCCPTVAPRCPPRLTCSPARASARPADRRAVGQGWPREKRTPARRVSGIPDCVVRGGGERMLSRAGVRSSSLLASSKHKGQAHWQRIAYPMPPEMPTKSPAI